MIQSMPEKDIFLHTSKSMSNDAQDVGFFLDSPSSSGKASLEVAHKRSKKQKRKGALKQQVEQQLLTNPSVPEADISKSVCDELQDVGFFLDSPSASTIPSSKASHTIVDKSFVDEQSKDVAPTLPQQQELSNDAIEVPLFSSSNVILAVGDDANEAEAEEAEPAKMRRGPRFRNARYTEIVEDGASGPARFQPGRISKELASALGLKNELQIPSFIYTMRQLGFPPGWLIAAVRSGGGAEQDGAAANMASTSGLTFHDESLATAGTLPDAASKLDKFQPLVFDYDKLARYPGFNTAPAHGVPDNHRQMNRPAMADFQQLPNFQRYLESQERRSQQYQSYLAEQAVEPAAAVALEKPAASGRKRALNNSADMELDSSEEADEAPQPKLSRGASIADLEVQRRQILAELGEDADEAVPEATSGSEVEEAPAASDSEAEEAPAMAGPQTPAPAASVSVLSRSLSCCLSSPVFDTGNSVRRLPQAEHFTAGIESFRPFENLPGTTGVFQRVSQALKNAKRKLGAAFK